MEETFAQRFGTHPVRLSATPVVEVWLNFLFCRVVDTIRRRITTIREPINDYTPIRAYSLLDLTAG